MAGGMFFNSALIHVLRSLLMKISNIWYQSHLHLCLDYKENQFSCKRELVFFIWPIIIIFHHKIVLNFMHDCEFRPLTCVYIFISFWRWKYSYICMINGFIIILPIWILAFALVLL